MCKEVAILSNPQPKAILSVLYNETKELESGETIHRPARAGFGQTESGEGELSAENFGNLLRHVSKASMGEIDNVIGELQTLRRKLQSDGDRIQRDIAKQVMQLTKIISDSVKKTKSMREGCLGTGCPIWPGRAHTMSVLLGGSPGMRLSGARGGRRQSIARSRTLVGNLDAIEGKYLLHHAQPVEPRSVGPSDDWPWCT